MCLKSKSICAVINEIRIEIWVIVVTIIKLAMLEQFILQNVSMNGEAVKFNLSTV